MEFLWFGWSGYPVIAFPAEMGRFYDHENAGLLARLERKLDDGFLQIVCVDSNDAHSWFNDSIAPSERGQRHEAYVSYVRDEIVPYVRERAQRDALGTFGCGFGAYHAANIAVRHPDVVTRAVCFDGRYDPRRFVDGYWSETERRNAPLDRIAAFDADEAAHSRNVAWAILAGNNGHADDGRALARTLAEKHIPAHLEVHTPVAGSDRMRWNEAAVRLI